MKKIILIAILLITTIDGFSKCAKSGLTFWPTKPTISKNSVFVIDGFGLSQKIIQGLGTTYKIYLKSDQQKIKLKVQEILVGQCSLTQAILKPETVLSNGKEYELIIENLGDFENQIYKYNFITNQREKIIWKVASDQDNSTPIWTDKPEFKNSTYERLGCGPAFFVNFTFSANDKSEFLIKTAVKNITTGNETIYYLAADENLIKVGRGMCSGAFTFDDGDELEVKFSLFDASGNQTNWTTEKIKFKRPTL